MDPHETDNVFTMSPPDSELGDEEFVHPAEVRRRRRKLRLPTRGRLLIPVVAAIAVAVLATSLLVSSGGRSHGATVANDDALPAQLAPHRAGPKGQSILRWLHRRPRTHRRPAPHHRTAPRHRAPGHHKPRHRRHHPGHRHNPSHHESPEPSSPEPTVESEPAPEPEPVVEPEVEIAPEPAPEPAPESSGEAGGSEFGFEE